LSACPLCEEPLSLPPDVHPGLDVHIYACPRCGNFEADGNAVNAFRHYMSPGWGSNRYLLSGLARNANVEGHKLRLHMADFGACERGQIPEPDVYGKLRLMLRWFERQSTGFGDWIAPNSMTDYPIASCRDSHEWTKLIFAAEKKDWLEHDGTGQRFHLTLEGRDWLRAQAPADAPQPKDPNVFTIPEPFSRYASEVAEFHKVWPFETSVFVMMKFPAKELPAATNNMLETILRTVRAELSRYGLNARCASDRTFGGSRRLWDNLCVYMLGSKYGLAVLEDRSGKDGKELNPNVTLEYGFMSALGRDVVLMQDEGFTSIRADLLSTIPTKFSIRADLAVDEQSIRKAVDDWMVDLGRPAARRS
jgi:hypothetical protein